MESKSGFWGVLARKAKSILEDENVSQQFEIPSRTMPQVIDSSVDGQVNLIYDLRRKIDRCRHDTC